MWYVYRVRIERDSNDTVIVEELGRRVARERIARNLTQRDFARRAGISPRALSAFENGKPVQLITLIHTLRALGMVGNLDLLIAEETFSPLSVRAVPRERKRASRSRSER